MLCPSKQGEIGMNFLMDNTANLIKYLRRVYGLNQGEIGDIMGVSTTTVSRLESGKSSMSFIQEHKLREHFGYAGEPIRKGHIELEGGKDAQTFATPIDWTSRLSSGKLGRIFRQLFLNYLSREEFRAFCRHHGVDELYFFNACNPVSINFHLRIIQHLRINRKLQSQEEIDHFVMYLMNEAGTLHNELAKIPDPYSRMMTAIQLLPKYEKNHSYGLERLSRGKKKIALKFRPNEDVMDYNLWKKDPYSGGFAENWIATSFMHILGHTLKSVSKFYRPSNPKDWYALEVELR